MLFCFLFPIRFQIGAFPPSRDCGLCHLSISCWLVFALSSRPPATMAACGRVLTLVSFVIAPAFSFNSPFFVSLHPRHAGGTRVVFDDGLPYHSAFFVSIPATLAVRGRFLTLGCLIKYLRFLHFFFFAFFLAS